MAREQKGRPDAYQVIDELRQTAFRKRRDKRLGNNVCKEPENAPVLVDSRG